MSLLRSLLLKGKKGKKGVARHISTERVYVAVPFAHPFGLITEKGARAIQCIERPTLRQEADDSTADISRRPHPTQAREHRDRQRVIDLYALQSFRHRGVRSQ